MNEHQTLTEKREQAHLEIFALKDKIPPAIILNLFDRWFPKSISELNLFYWILQIVLINAAIVFPGLLLSLALGEIEKWPKFISSSIAAIEMAIFGLIQAHVFFRLAFHELANHTVYKIANLEDLSALVAFCRDSASSIYAFLGAGSILWFVWTLSAWREFPGVGLTFMVIVTGGLVNISLQALFWAITLANKLKDFQYELNTFAPANSEVVIRLSGMLNKIVYLTANFFVVFTLLVSSGFFGSQINRTFAVPFTMLGWTLIIIQFLVHRSTINGIVEKERWTSLNKLQLQMNTIQAAEDLSDKDVSERLLRLADLHERIRTNRAGRFDVKSLLTLFSQLMLPLLGLLLGNIDTLMDFLK